MLRAGGKASVEEFVEFRSAGEIARGAHRCTECGYGVAVYSALPRCPMCGGETWEPSESRAPARAPSSSRAP